jgi:hypothetical protein
MLCYRLKNSASAAATAKNITNPVKAGIAQLELGNSHLPQSKRLLLLIIEPPNALTLPP